MNMRPCADAISRRGKRGEKGESGCRYAYMGTDRFLVQGGLGVGFDEEAANDLQQQGSVFHTGFWQDKKLQMGSKGYLLTRRMWLSLQSDFQSFFSVFTQISPFFAMFGWKIGVMKKPLGGAAGKSWPNTSFILKKPPS